jgi:hypothetical protein
MSNDKKNFVDFILDAQKDQRLAGEFLQQQNADELGHFFKKHGYLGIHKDDPQKLIQAKENFGQGLNRGFGEDYY